MNTGGKVFVAILALPVVLYIAQQVRVDRALRTSPRVVVPPAPAPASRRARLRVEWQEKLIQSPEYAGVVREALPVAEAGDADAQFALYTAFSFCADALRKRPDAELRQIPEPLLQMAHARCDALAIDYKDFSRESARWLDRAVQSKYPRALAETGLRQVESMSRTMKPAERSRLAAEARANLLLALGSNDPVVTWTAAEALPGLFPDEPGIERAYWLWKLAACNQGADCGPDAPWVQHSCQMRRNCLEGESGEDYIRRVSGDFAKLHALAGLLAKELGSGEFGDADFEYFSTGLQASVQH